VPWMISIYLASINKCPFSDETEVRCATVCEEGLEID
jgi:hypothetical protein